MASSNRKVGYHPVGTAICLHVKEVGKPSLDVAPHCVKAQCCEHDGNELDKLREGWAFRADIWNVDLLTGRVGELMEVLTNRWIDTARDKMEK